MQFLDFYNHLPAFISFKPSSIMSATKQSTITFPVRKSTRLNHSAQKSNSESPLVGKIEALGLVTPVKTSPVSKKASRVSRGLFRLCDENQETSPSKLPRVTFVDEKDKTVLDKYEAVKCQLNPSCPASLLYRDVEYKKIESFVKECFRDDVGGSMYISGAPGTGKTLCVTTVLDNLSSGIKFKRLFINCMACRTPNSIYYKIVSELGIESPRNVKDTLNLIESQIITPKKGKKGAMTIIVLDEIDELENKSQDVLYTLFQWPAFDMSRVIVIGIANTLDLTTRSLKRLRSLNVVEINFQPYTKDQVKGILSARLLNAQSKGEEPLIKDTALELCARKVASFSGDIRKALDVCRRAVELVEGESRNTNSSNPMELLRETNDDRCNPGSPRKSTISKTDHPVSVVAVTHVKKVLDEVYGSKVIEIDSGKSLLPTQQQLVLCSLVLLSKCSKKKDIDLSKCHKVFAKVCRLKCAGFGSENSSEFVTMCQLLESKGFLLMKSVKEKGVLQRKLSLSVEESEIDQVLTDKTLLKSILTDPSFTSN